MSFNLGATTGMRIEIEEGCVGALETLKEALPL